MAKKRILVVDDKIENLEAAKIQLSSEYEVVTAQTFMEVRGLLHLDTILMNAGYEFGPIMFVKKLLLGEEAVLDLLSDRNYSNNPELQSLPIIDWFDPVQYQKYIVDSGYTMELCPDYIKSSAISHSLIKKGFGFDVVITDLMMPGESHGVYKTSPDIGKEVPYGLSVAALAVNAGVPNVILFSDLNHHEGAIVNSLDYMEWFGPIHKAHCYKVKMMINGAEHEVKNYLSIFKSH